MRIQLILRTREVQFNNQLSNRYRMPFNAQTRYNGTYQKVELKREMMIHFSSTAILMQTAVFCPFQERENEQKKGGFVYSF